MKKYISILSLYLLIFGPSFTLIDIQIISILIFSVVGIWASLKVKEFKAIWAVVFIFTLLVAIPMVAINRNEYIILIQFFAYIFSVYGFFYLYGKTNDQISKTYHLWEDEIIAWVYYLCVFDAIVICSFFLFPELHQSINKVLDFQMKNQIENNFSGIRYNNLSIAGGHLSVVYFIGMLAGFHLLKNGYIKFLSLTFGLVLLSTGIILSGRIGMLFALMYILGYLIKSILTLKISKIIIVIVFGAIILQIIMLNYVDKELYDFVLEPFTGSNFLSTKSTSNLINSHFHFVDNLNMLQILIGVGNSYSSDSLYFKLYHWLGLFGLLIFFSIVGSWVIGICNKKKILQNSPALFSMTILVYYLIANIKQTTLGNGKGASFLFILLILLGVYKNISSPTLKKLS